MSNKELKELKELRELKELKTIGDEEMRSKELRSESSHYNNLSYLRNLRDLLDKKLSVSIRVNPWSSKKICEICEICVTKNHPCQSVSIRGRLKICEICEICVTQNHPCESVRSVVV